MSEGQPSDGQDEGQVGDHGAWSSEEESGEAKTARTIAEERLKETVRRAAREASFKFNPRLGICKFWDAKGDH